MRKFLIIPGALLAFILFSAKSCDEDPAVTRRQAEETMQEVMDSVKAEFGAEYLDEESLFVFARKAKQKLKDYSDYTNIANDTAVDSVFRSQALTMSKELLFKGSAPAEPAPGVETDIDSVWLVVPLHMAGEDFYKGRLGFREVVIKKSTEDTISGASFSKEVEILAIKESKISGTDTLKVWQVYLGNFY